MTDLADAIQRIQLKEDMSTILSAEKLDDIECAAINLSAAVMDCLAIAIICASKKSPRAGIHLPIFTTLTCISDQEHVHRRR